MMQRAHRKPQAPAGGRDSRRGRGRTAEMAAPAPSSRRRQQVTRKKPSQDESAACVFAEFARLSGGMTQQEQEMCWASMCALFVTATAGTCTEEQEPSPPEAVIRLPS